MSSTAWFNIQKPYYYQASSVSSQVNTTGPILLGTTVKDSYSFSTSLTYDNIISIISNKIRSAQLPYDPNAIYLVLTSSDVTEGSFCSSYCGYHSYFTTTSNQEVIFSFIGNAAKKCPYSCIAYNQNVSPNKDVGVDGMLSVIAHEIVEAMSDPELDAWADINGEENADKCAWTFGKLLTASNGAYYNLVANNYKYLIQQNWNRLSNQCLMSL